MMGFRITVNEFSRNVSRQRRHLYPEMPVDNEILLPVNEEIREIIAFLGLQPFLAAEPGNGNNMNTSSFQGCRNCNVVLYARVRQFLTIQRNVFM